MKTISNLSFDVQHRIANTVVFLGFKRAGYAYKTRLDDRLTHTLTSPNN